MKEIEVEFEDGYFVGPSPIGRNSKMSLRAKGLMYVFFTLPPNWDYSLNGLIAICQEGRDVIKNTLNELKRFGYVEINQVRDEKGHFRYKYIVHRKSVLEEKLKDNSPLTEYPSTDSPMTVDQRQLKDLIIKDKIDKTELRNSEHNEFTKELIKYKYIEDDDSSSFLFDQLFEDYLEKGYTKRELMMSIHYIVPRVIDRKFEDEEGYKINNKFGYFKNALESNFLKLENFKKDIYSEDYCEDLLKDFEK